MKCMVGSALRLMVLLTVSLPSQVLLTRIPLKLSCTGPVRAMLLCSDSSQANADMAMLENGVHGWLSLIDSYLHSHLLSCRPAVTPSIDLCIARTGLAFWSLAALSF